MIPINASMILKETFFVFIKSKVSLQDSDRRMTNLC